MNKQIALKLNNAAEYAANVFSNPDREHNYGREEFRLERIHPLSEFTAAVTYVKTEGKTALAFFYYVNTGDGQWRYFFPSDSHILGMLMFDKRKQTLEEHNYPLNFEKTIQVNEI